MKATYTLETASGLTSAESFTLRAELNKRNVPWTSQRENYYTILRVTFESPETLYWFAMWLESYTGLRWNQTSVSFER